MSQIRRDTDYASVMARKGEILRTACGIDYEEFRRGRLEFDYEGLMASTGYGLDEIAAIQTGCKVGNTALLELPNLTRLARRLAPPRVRGPHPDEGRSGERLR